MGAPFCASCLDDDCVLIPVTIDDQTVAFCMACARGNLRSGRWSFSESEEKRLAVAPERKTRRKGKE